MAEKFPDFRPDYAVHPGETLAEILEERDMSQSELAERMGRPKKAINEIVKGKAAITEDTAIQLERVLGVPAYFWLNLQTIYREAIARMAERSRLKGQEDFLRQFPIREMVRRKWLDDGHDKVDQLILLMRFFGVASPQAWETRTATYRASRAHKADPGPLSVWLRKGELEAEAIQTAPFDAKRFRTVLSQLRAMTSDDPRVFTPKMVDMCASAGVALVFVKEFPKCPSGATYWLNAQKAVIQLSLRYKLADQFWFTFYHEAGHVLQLQKDGVIFAGNQSQAAESSADAFACDMLIPPNELSEFLQTHRGDIINTSDILRFAKNIGITPGCVVGRLQHDGIVPYSHFNGLKVKYVWAVEKAE